MTERLKVAGFNEPIETYKLYISDFLCRWPIKVMSISWLSHYKSMGENQLAHFSQILVVIAASILDDISYNHPRLYLDADLTMWQPWGHVTSNITKMVLPKASHRNKLHHREWSHCVQLSKTHRMIYILILRSRKGYVTWGQIMTLTLWGHVLILLHILHILMCIKEKILMMLLVLLKLS